MPKAPPRFDAMRVHYATLWSTVKVRPKWAAAVDRRARKIIGNRSTYEKVEARTGVPWYFIGALHGRESGQSFSTHLHNGDSLRRRTRRRPRGRPRWGNPPYEWHESADDALRIKGLHKIKNWSIERILFEGERFNGWGYVKYRDHLSPYVWSGTYHYSGYGKYTSDGNYSRTAREGQTGIAAVIKRVLELTEELGRSPPIEIEVPLPERRPEIADEIDKGPVDEEEDSDVPTPKADDGSEAEPMTEAARKSKTIFGALVALFAAIVQWLEDAVQVLIDTAAQLTAWEPAKAVLGSLGANVGSVAFGVTVAAIVLVISRRLNAAATGKVG